MAGQGSNSTRQRHTQSPRQNEKITSGYRVYINVYDIINKNRMVEKIGMGIYHTGIEINGSEYAYGGNSLMETTGVYEIEPRSHEAFAFRETLEAGYAPDWETVWDSLQSLMKKYKANQYDMLMRNCNHFSDEFLRLITGQGLPSHLNRAAYVGSFLHCLVPRKYLIVTPPG